MENTKKEKMNNLSKIKNKSIKNKIIMGLFFISFALLIISTMINIHLFPYKKNINVGEKYELLESKELYANVNVSKGNRGGFDLNKSALTFGKISLGGSATRSINFENNYNFAVYVKISANGDIANLLFFNEIEFVKAKENKRIGFSVITNNETKVGFYEGKVKIDVYPAWVDIEKLK
ncbi:MAG: hypothetical protein N3D20_01615 [Candidatus Pacearchaeota archaeon]|nr:hypothetical protein [Candidatus Pacearchaeota archaeon]